MATFGTLFNDIVVQRFDTNENRIQTIAVPLAYGPKQKFILKLRDSGGIDQPVGLQLPRMGFELTGMLRATDRQLSPITKNVKLDTADEDILNIQFIGVPYDFSFELSIFVKNADDGAQIIEQILPFFQPDWSLTLNLIDELQLKEDVSIVLDDLQVEDSYEGTEEASRNIIWTLNFTFKAKMYGPTQKQGVIKRTQIDFMAVGGHGPVTGEDINATGRSSRIVITPGLTADGEPTSNSLASIHYSLIDSSDPYGFVQDFTFYEDGFKYDPVSGIDKRIIIPGDGHD